MLATKVRRLAALPLAALLAGGLFVGTTPSAQAALSDCLFETSCMWTGESYVGTRASFKNSLVPSSTNNAINSVYNNGRISTAHYYDRADFTGAKFTLNVCTSQKQCRDPKLSNGTDATTVAWHNRISSAKFG